jgi:hypothetical protein
MFHVDANFLVFAAIVVIVFVAVMRSRGRALSRMPRICRSCGAAHPGFARFCRRCGHRL